MPTHETGGTLSSLRRWVTMSCRVQLGAPFLSALTLDTHDARPPIDGLGGPFKRGVGPSGA